MTDLTGQVVLVTGGTSGIGRATALAFADREARVAVAARGEDRGRRVVEEIGEAGGEAVFIRADMAEPGEVEAMVDAVVERYGRLDAAVNNAARGHPPSRTADLPEEEYDRTMAVNLKGVWLSMKHEIRQMLAQSPPGGAVVNTSSVNGLGGAPRGAVYSASKAGVLGLTKSAAQEYAGDGIRINALVPGAVRTPMLEGAIEDLSGGDPEAREVIERDYRASTALGRVGRPEEAAEVAVWLCSEHASYVIGHSLIADGGLSASTR